MAGAFFGNWDPANIPGWHGLREVFAGIDALEAELDALDRQVDALPGTRCEQCHCRLDPANPSPRYCFTCTALVGALLDHGNTGKFYWEERDREYTREKERIKRMKEGGL